MLIWPDQIARAINTLLHVTDEQTAASVAFVVLFFWLALVITTAVTAGLSLLAGWHYLFGDIRKFMAEMRGDQQ